VNENSPLGDGCFAVSFELILSSFEMIAIIKEILTQHLRLNYNNSLNKAKQ
jgi:hypothetical protein